MDQLHSDAWPADDRYAAQRLAGFRWLRFGPDLENEYRENYIAVNALRIRAASILGMFAIFGFVGVDQFLGMNLQDMRSDLLLMIGTVPAILVPLAVTYRRRAGSYLLPLLFSGVTLMALSIVAVIYLGRLQNPWFPSESLILVTSYVFFLSGLMFYPAVACGALVWACFLAADWIVQSHDKMLYEVYYLAIVNGLGWLGLYLLEYQARTSWLLQNELRRLAVLDSLTGLMNRRAFTQHLETAWLQAQRALAPVGLMLIDLDGFKRVNDTCGHQFGDLALQHVAQQLRASVLRPLDAAARYGGDEFIAVWYDVDGNWLQRLAQDFPGRLAELSYGEGETRVRITVSGGAVVAWPRPGLSPRDAIREADRKLYEMKRGDTGKIGFVVLNRPEQEQSAA